MARPLAARLRSTGLVVGGVALGVAVAVGVPELMADDAPALNASRSADVDPKTLLDPTRLENVDGDRLRADSPREAVEAFLSAEQEGDDERSFALLADEVRLEYGSAAAWAADPDAVSPLRGFEVTAAEDGDAQATVQTETRYVSSLDPVAGLVPARARTSWAVVREDGGWAVDLFETVEEPLLPPEDGADDAVRRWAQELQTCPDPPPSPVGQASLARSLCGAAGPVQAATSVAPLSPLDAGALQSAFGDVTSWARVVDVASPVALRAVVAPVDDAWTVVAVLAPAGQAR